MPVGFVVYVNYKRLAYTVEGPGAITRRCVLNRIACNISHALAHLNRIETFCVLDASRAALGTILPALSGNAEKLGEFTLGLRDSILHNGNAISAALASVHAPSLRSVRFENCGAVFHLPHLRSPILRDLTITGPMEECTADLLLSILRSTPMLESLKLDGQIPQCEPTVSPVTLQNLARLHLVGKAESCSQLLRCLDCPRPAALVVCCDASHITTGQLSTLIDNIARKCTTDQINSILLSCTASGRDALICAWPKPDPVARINSEQLRLNFTWSAQSGGSVDLALQSISLLCRQLSFPVLQIAHLDLPSSSEQGFWVSILRTFYKVKELHVSYCEPDAGLFSALTEVDNGFQDGTKIPRLLPDMKMMRLMWISLRDPDITRSLVTVFEQRRQCSSKNRDVQYGIRKVHFVSCELPTQALAAVQAEVREVSWSIDCRIEP